MSFFSLVPRSLGDLQRRNFINVQIDAVGVGIAAGAYPFVPVLMARLGASNMQVGLLASLPALAGLLLSVPLGRVLENKGSIVQTFSAARLTVFLSNVFIGIAPLLLPFPYAVLAILIIAGLVTIPNTLVNLGFTIIMNEVAGPHSRYELLSRRWAIIALSSSIVLPAAGFLLAKLPFPQGYPLVFSAVTLGAFLSYTYSRKIDIPSRAPSPHAKANGFVERNKALVNLVVSHKPLLSFNVCRFILYLGMLALYPVYPLYFVRQVHASDFWIGAFSTAQSVTLLLGYFFWTEIKKRKGVPFVLRIVMIGSSFYPFLVAATTNIPAIFVFALIGGIFSAGLDLLLFDEMLKRIPSHAQTPLVSYSQTIYYLAAIFGPFLGTFLADQLGLTLALVLGGAIRLFGAGSFCLLPEHET